METYRQKWQRRSKKKKKNKREFGQIQSGNPDHKSDKQLYTIKNVKNICHSRQKVIDLFNNYSKIRSEVL